ncbi:MAG: acyl-CoA dehydrogenase family protein, partial [Cyanobacteria bacterium]|nr:acyl-CoA dehydrogenase family protein [Cyanobacteriota bacterium]
MTQFTLTEERNEFKKLAKEFSDGELAPNAHQFDSTGEFAREIFEKAWEIGLVNFQVPEEVGGLGLSNLDACVILEELACGCSGISAPIEATTLAQIALIKLGTPDQKQEYLKPLMESPIIAGYASHQEGVNRITVSKNNSEFVLNGTHASVSNGGIADWYLVHARAESQFLTFILPKDISGLTVESRGYSIGRKAGI